MDKEKGVSDTGFIRGTIRWIAVSDAACSLRMIFRSDPGQGNQLSQR
jgi:hypothetical protein